MGCSQSQSKIYSPTVKLESNNSVLLVDWIHNDLISDISMAGFENAKVLGKGKFGIVYMSKCVESKKYVAIKYIPKEIIFESKALVRIKQEIQFASTLSHPFIIEYFGNFVTETCIALVFRCALGGEFFTRMKSQETMPETHALFYFAEIALALKYLHDMHIVYRDLKPENILLDEFGHVKLCDFGFAAYLKREQDGMLNDGCGTAMYVAPEIANGSNRGHGIPVDWWGLGIILYEMLTGI